MLLVRKRFGCHCANGGSEGALRAQEEETNERLDGASDLSQYTHSLTRTRSLTHSTPTGYLMTKDFNWGRSTEKTDAFMECMYSQISS